MVEQVSSGIFSRINSNTYNQDSGTIVILWCLFYRVHFIDSVHFYCLFTRLYLFLAFWLPFSKETYLSWMFMALSSWQSHCESSLGSRDEYRTAPGGRRPLDQVNRLEPQAHLHKQPIKCIQHYYYYHDTVLIFMSHGGQKAESLQSHCVCEGSGSVTVCALVKHLCMLPVI